KAPDAARPELIGGVVLECRGVELGLRSVLQQLQVKLTPRERLVESGESNEPVPPLIRDPVTLGEALEFMQLPGGPQVEELRQVGPLGVLRAEAGQPAGAGVGIDGALGQEVHKKRRALAKEAERTARAERE